MTSESSEFGDQDTVDFFSAPGHPPIDLLKEKKITKLAEDFYKVVYLPVRAHQLTGDFRAVDKIPRNETVDEMARVLRSPIQGRAKTLMNLWWADWVKIREAVKKEPPKEPDFNFSLEQIRKFEKELLTRPHMTSDTQHINPKLMQEGHHHDTGKMPKDFIPNTPKDEDIMDISELLKKKGKGTNPS